MRKLTNKLFISILSVAFAIVALGTTTFAWFTLSNQATIQPFYGDVTAGQGIEISLDGVNWYSSITPEVMHGYLFNGYTDGAGTPHDAIFGTNFKFNQVTSANGTTLSSYNGIPISEASLLNHPYLVFNVMFRSPEAVDIYWSDINFPALIGETSLGKEWTADTAFTSAKGDPVLASSTATYYAKDAARVSVESSTKVLVYEDRKDTTVTNTILGGLTAQNLVTLGSPYTDGAVSYFYAKNNAYPTGITSVTVPTTVTLNTSDSSQKLLTLVESGNYYVGEVTVRIWIEGWDQDCFNAILTARLAVSLEFLGVKA